MGPAEVVPFALPANFDYEDVLPRSRFVLLVTLASYIFFSTLLLILRKLNIPKHRSPLPDSPMIMASMIVSTVHAILSTYLSVYSFFKENNLMVRKTWVYAFAGSVYRDGALAVTLGYLLQDLFLMIYKDMTADSAESSKSYPEFHLDRAMYVHHVTIILAFTLGLRYQVGTFYMCVLLTNEISHAIPQSAGTHTSRRQRPSLGGRTTSLPSHSLRRAVLGNGFLFSHMYKNMQLELLWPRIRMLQQARFLGIPAPVCHILPTMFFAHFGLQLMWSFQILSKAFFLIGNNAPESS